MIFKTFTVFHVNEGLPIIRDRLMMDSFDADMEFAGAIPDQIENDPEAKHSTGFLSPTGDAISNACATEVPVNHRLYRLVHVDREKQIDPAGIHERCRSERDDWGDIELQDEVDRRVTAAMAIAPITDTYTSMMVRGDGVIVVGAALKQAENVVRDFLRLFAWEEDDKGDRHSPARYEHDQHLFNSVVFNRECTRILSRDVWELDDLGEYTAEEEPALQFDGAFAVKLKEKARLTVANVKDLPYSLSSFIDGAEYANIALTVTTDSCKYKLKLTSKGEVKSCSVMEHGDDEFESNERWVMDQMLQIYSQLKSQFARQPE